MVCTRIQHILILQHLTCNDCAYQVALKVEIILAERLNLPRIHFVLQLLLLFVPLINQVHAVCATIFLSEKKQIYSW